MGIHILSIQYSFPQGIGLIRCKKLMKRIVREINIRRQRGRDGSYYFFQLFSVNLLGELYWKLPIVIKDT